MPNQHRYNHKTRGTERTPETSTDLSSLVERVVSNPGPSFVRWSRINQMAFCSKNSTHFKFKQKTERRIDATMDNNNCWRKRSLHLETIRRGKNYPSRFLLSYDKIIDETCDDEELKSSCEKQTITMSLRCLAILGSKNEPLYICASGPSEDESDNSAELMSSSTPQQGEDVFGFFSNDNALDDDSKPEDSKSEFIKRPASIRHEVRILGFCFDRIKAIAPAKEISNLAIREIGRFVCLPSSLKTTDSMLVIFPSTFSILFLEPCHAIDDDSRCHWSNRRKPGIAQKSFLEAIPTWEPLDGATVSDGGIRCTYIVSRSLDRMNSWVHDSAIVGCHEATICRVLSPAVWTNLSNLPF